MNIPHIFALCLNATVFGTVVGMIIYLLKSTFLRRLSAGWQYYLWSVMIIKLIFPKGPQSNISVFNSLNLSGTLSEQQLLETAVRAQEVSASARGVFDILAYIWAAGCVLALLWLCFSFIHMRLKISRCSAAPCDRTLSILDECKDLTGVKHNIGIVVQNHVPTAALCGLIRPKILITPEFEASHENHMKYCFIHELSHYKRGDVAVNYLLLLLSCFHWFNPALWFLFARVRRDTELATDEKTMLCLKPDNRSNYGMALIDTISRSRGRTPAILGMANNKQDMKKRIMAIACFKKPGFMQHISGLFTILFIASVCLTSAVIAKPITDMIYQSIPEVEALISLTTVPELEPIEDDKEADTPTEAPDTAEEAAAEPPAPLPDTVDKVIALTGQSLHSGEGVADINTTAKLISYNSDSKADYSFIMKPNSAGHIQLMIEENSIYDHVVQVDMSNVKTPGYGWSYRLYSGSSEPFFIDGLYPDEEYIVTISTYCPGYYGIDGKVLIY